MDEAIRKLFSRYEDETNAALKAEPDMAAIGDLYDAAFIGSSPDGVMVGNKDADFEKALAQGFAHNREIGARQMDVRNLRLEPIDQMHALVHVDWRATYEKAGTPKTIDFTNAYLTRVQNGKARVFGWITGDENAVLRQQGII